MMQRPELPEKALSIKQPWAEAIVRGFKPVENRTWNTKFRGRFCIHTAAKQSQDGYEHEFVMRHAPDLVSVPRILNGHIIGTVELVDVVEEFDNPWFFGPKGFMLKNPILLENPIPLKGQLGFFNWRNRMPCGALL